MATDVKVSIIAPTEITQPGPSSCGLDIWQFGRGFEWVSNYFGGQPACLSIKDGSRFAKLRLLLRRMPLAMQLASSHPYGCIEGEVSLFWNNVERISQELRRMRIACLEIPFTGEYAYQLAGSLNYRAPNLQAVRHVMDLRDYTLQDLERRFHPNIRWSVRKALRNNCQVRHATFEEVGTVQSLYAQTMQAKGAPVHYGAERLMGIIKDLKTINCGNIFLGEINGEACGMAAVVDGKLSRHLVQLAVPPQWQKSRLGELLVMTAIQEAVEQNIHYFDFMASGKSDHGLIDFKAKWGGDSQPIHYSIVPGIPGMQNIIKFARWVNKTRARLGF